MATQATALKARPRARGGTRYELRKRLLRSRLPKSARLVGFTLAEMMYGENFVITNNVTIAKKSALSVRTVQTATAELVRRRYIRRTRPDGRFAWRYEPVAPRGAKAASRGVVVALRGANSAPQDATVAPENPGLRTRGSEHKNKALSATRKAKAEAGADTLTPDEALELAWSKVGRRRSRPPAPPRESQLDKYLEQSKPQPRRRR